MQIPNVLETPVHQILPESKNEFVGTISKEETAWLAGIMDGEGCIHTVKKSLKEIKSGKRKNWVTLRIEIGSSSPEMIQRISQLYSKMGIKYFYVYQKTYKKDYMRIVIQSLNACRVLLESIVCFLTAKRNEAEVVLEYLSWRSLAMQGEKFGRNNVIASKLEELRRCLMSLKNTRLDFQRLPREACKVLDLSKLQVVV